MMWPTSFITYTVSCLDEGIFRIIYFPTSIYSSVMCSLRIIWCNTNLPTFTCVYCGGTIWRHAPRRKTVSFLHGYISIHVVKNLIIIYCRHLSLVVWPFDSQPSQILWKNVNEAVRKIRVLTWNYFNQMSLGSVSVMSIDFVHKA